MNSPFNTRRAWLLGAIIVLLCAVSPVLLVQNGIVAGASQSEGGAPVREYRMQILRGQCETVNPEQTQALASAELLGGTEETGWTFASETVIEVPIGDLLAQPHAIAVVAEGSAGGLGIPLACSEITGQVTGGKLVLGLISSTTGGLAGIAVLADQGEQQTVVDVYLILASDGTTIGQGDITDEAQDAVDDTDDEGGLENVDYGL